MTGPAVPRNCGAAGAEPTQRVGTLEGLKATKQSFHENPDGTRTFDHPEDTGKSLDSHQGKVKNFQGTCGIVSCVNMFRLMGMRMTEETLVRFASSTLNEKHTAHLCMTGHSAGSNGGTSVNDRREILAAFGMESFCEKCTVETIARRVEEGRGVIISVDADLLYYGTHLARIANHAVTVTATKRDASGSILGFYVCDSNDKPCDYYPAFTIEQALTGKQMNVTNLILR